MVNMNGGGPLQIGPSGVLTADTVQPGFGGVYSPWQQIPREDSRTLSLESMDGTVSIPLNVDTEHLLLPGATGLDLPPIQLVTAQTPGIDGAWLQEADVLQRTVVLPLLFASESSHADFLATLAVLRGVVAGWEQVSLGSTGTFRLVATSGSSERLLDVTYSAGMEGAWGGTDSGGRWQKYSVTLIAVDPYWRSRGETVYTFTQQPPVPFIGGVWPSRIVNDFDVVSVGVLYVGEIPAWPVIEVDGPSAHLEIAWPGTTITVSALTAGQTLTLATDPRQRSARINGQVSWSAISLGSTISALPAGNARIDVAGLPENVTITFRAGFKTAFG